MQKLEQVICNTLHKVDASDTSIRQKVYRTVWSKHERSLATATLMSETEKSKRRSYLTYIIRIIEDKYRISNAGFNDQLHAVSPGVERSAGFASGIGPEEEPCNFAADSVTNADEWPQHQHKRFWLAANAFPLILFFITVFVIWSFYNTLTGSPRVPDDPHASNAPMRLLQEEQNQKSGWIQVFNPANITSLEVRGAATAQIYNETDTSFVRVQASGAKDAAIIEIGEGTLMHLRGKTATLNIVARSTGSNPTQLSLICDFGNGKVTGRRRFEVPPARETLLFNVDIPQSINNPAKLYIVSDLSGEKHGVDIFSVLINTGNEPGRNL